MKGIPRLFHLEPSLWSDEFQLRIGGREARPDGRFLVVSSLTVTDVPEGICRDNIINPADGVLEVTSHQLQDLCDTLHRLGFKPKGEAEKTGELAATKTHLEDMRAIVAVQLEINLPGHQA